MSKPAKSSTKTAKVRERQELSWFLLSAESALGESGTYQKTISVAVSGWNCHDTPPLCNDEQLGWGRWYGRGTVRKEAMLRRAWKELSLHDRTILRAYYAPPVKIPLEAQAVLGKLAGPAFVLGFSESGMRAAKRSARQAVAEAHKRWDRALKQAKKELGWDG